MNALVLYKSDFLAKKKALQLRIMEKQINFTIIIIFYLVITLPGINMLTDEEFDLNTNEVQLNGYNWLREHWKPTKRLTRSLADNRWNKQNSTASDKIDQIVRITKLNQSGPLISLYYVGRKRQVREYCTLTPKIDSQQR